MVVVAVKGVKAIPSGGGGGRGERGEGDSLPLWTGCELLKYSCVYICLRLFTVCPGLPRFGAVQLFSHNNELDRANGTPTEENRGKGILFHWNRYSGKATVLNRHSGMINPQVFYHI